MVADENTDFIPLIITLLIFSAKINPRFKNILLSRSRQKRAKDNLAQKVHSIGSQRKGQIQKAVRKKQPTN